MNKKDKFLKLTSGAVLLGSAPSLVSMAVGNGAEEKKKDPVEFFLQSLINFLGIVTIFPYVWLLKERSRRLSEIETELKKNSEILEEKNSTLKRKDAELKEKNEELEENTLKFDSLNKDIEILQKNLTKKDADLAPLDSRLEEAKKDLEEKNKALSLLKTQSEQAEKDLEEKNKALTLLKTQSERAKNDLEEKNKTLNLLKAKYEKEQLRVDELKKLESEIEEGIAKRIEDIESKLEEIKNIQKEEAVLDREFALKEKEINTEEEKLNLLREAKFSLEELKKNIGNFVEFSNFLQADKDLKLEENFKDYEKKLKERFLVFKIEVNDEDYNDEKKLSAKFKDLVEAYDSLSSTFEKRFNYIVYDTSKSKKVKVTDKEGKCTIDSENLKKYLKNFLGVLSKFNMINDFDGKPVSSLFADKQKKLKEIYEKFDELFVGKGVNAEEKYNEICKDVKAIHEEIWKFFKDVYSIGKKGSINLKNLLEKRKECKNKIDEAKKCIESFNKKYNEKYTPEDIGKILFSLESNQDIGCKFYCIAEGFKKAKEIYHKFLKGEGGVNFDYDTAYEKILKYNHYDEFGLMSKLCEEFLGCYDEHEKAFLENEFKKQEEKVEKMKNEVEKIRRNLQKVRCDDHSLSTQVTGNRYDVENREDWLDGVVQSKEDHLKRVSEKKEEIDKVSEERKNLELDREKNLAEQVKLKNEVDSLFRKCKDLNSEIEEKTKDQSKFNEELNKLSKEYETLLSEKGVVSDKQEKLNEEIRLLSTERDKLESEKKGILEDKEKLNAEISLLSTERDKLESEKKGILEGIETLKAGSKEADFYNKKIINLENEKNNINNNFYSVDFFKSFGQDKA